MAELCYFEDIGRGESIKLVISFCIIPRLALDLAKIHYRDNIIPPEEWPEIKSKGVAEGSLPFGQLPLLKIDGLNISQSTSILRYLSRKSFLFIGSSVRYISVNADDAMQTLIDMMIEGWDDVLSGYFVNLFNGSGVLKSWLCG